MTRRRKELIWTTMALAGIGAGAMIAASANGEDDPPLKGPEVKQEGERRGPRAEGQMRPEGERGQRGEGQRGETRPGDPLRRLLEGITLSDEQREQVRAIIQEQGEKARAFREEHQTEFEQLRKDMQAAREAGDREKMRVLAQKHRELVEKGPRGEAIEKIKAVLTPEQIKTFEENLARERQRMQNPAGRGPGGGERLSPEQRERLEKMSPEERERFMREQRERRQQREGQNRGDAPRDGGKLEI